MTTEFNKIYTQFNDRDVLVLNDITRRPAERNEQNVLPQKLSRNYNEHTSVGRSVDTDPFCKIHNEISYVELLFMTFCLGT